MESVQEARNLVTKRVAEIDMRDYSSRQDSDLKVLVVDDSPVYRELIKQSLSQECDHILFASDGTEALKLLAKHHPEVVITDWTMPGITGPELCQRIRNAFQQYYPYVLLVTSNANKEQVIQGLASGADDYITKPFHQGELLARVGVGRRIAQLHREVESKNRQLEEMAMTDPLTGLPNRRAINAWADRELSAAARHKFPVWVSMADLDHFKGINDTFGHDAGDAVLKGFSESLKVNTRRSNLCGRLGGEEFLMILTHIDSQQALIALDRIRTRFASQKFEFEDRTVRVTASFGVAGFCVGRDINFNDVLARADEAMYLAKSKGRNRVEFECRLEG
jgi:two-component system, cell cycle response regulator